MREPCILRSDQRFCSNDPVRASHGHVTPFLLRPGKISHIQRAINRPVNPVCKRTAIIRNKSRDMVVCRATNERKEGRKEERQKIFLFYALDHTWKKEERKRTVINGFNEATREKEKDRGELYFSRCGEMDVAISRAIVDQQCNLN